MAATLLASALISGERIRSTMALRSTETGAPNSPIFVLIFVIFIIKNCKDTKKNSFKQIIWRKSEKQDTIVFN